MNTTLFQLESGETIILTVRRHWFMLAIEILGIVITALLPAIFYTLLAISTDLFEKLNGAYAALPVTAYAAWLLIMWMALFSVWTNYYLDIWTLTNKRLITVDQRGFFHRRTASFRLERLQDVVISINGFIPTFLNYGTVEIQTASEEGNFIMRGLPFPEEIKAEILSASGIASTPKDQSNTGGM